jgi:arylsulfatase A-like enzyme
MKPKHGDAAMGRNRIWSAAVGMLILAAGVLAADAQGRQPACAAIRQACEMAGFVQGGAKSGEGIVIDCIAPIMRGAPQPRRATLPLPEIDPQLVAQCRTQNPNFGMRNAQPAQGGPAPAQAPGAGQGPAPLPPNATEAPPQMQPAPRPQTAAPPQVAPPQVEPPAPPQAQADRPQTTAASLQPRSQNKRPNIVFILTDDLSWNLVQYMPHVQKMQHDGMTFANFFVTDSLCCPSRSSIFTGRYPHNTGIFRNTGDDGGYVAFHNRGHEQETFAVALAAAGYRTAMLGKYLNGYLPARDPVPPGWSFWAVAGNGYPGFNYNLNQDGRPVHHGAAPADYLTDVLSGLASDFIKRPDDKPFMIEVATFAPHMPYTPAPRDAEAFAGLGAPRTPAFGAAPDADAPRWLKAHAALSDADAALIDRDFRKRAQSVLAVDRMIGELQAAVAAIGAQDNTYFVFSSDNGYHMGEHNLMPGKMTAFDTDIHVPLIVTGPGIAAGSVAQEITENIDLCPTFSELAGAAPGGAAPIEAPVDGRSLARLLRGDKEADWRSVALVEHHGPVRDPVDPDRPGLRSGNPTSYEAIRGATSLYVEYADGETEYHDLAADPDEMHNSVAALSADQRAALHGILAATQKCRGAQDCTAAETATRALTQR